jgi:hypothetical protein
MSFYDKVRRQKVLSFSLILFTLAIGVLIGTLMQTGAKAAKEQVVAPDATPLTIPNSDRIYPQEADHNSEQAESPVPPPAAAAGPG